MPSVTLKNIPPELHEQLKREGEANFRTLNQEILARLQKSFDADDRTYTLRDQRWVKEALDSGPETPLLREEMDRVRDRVLRRGSKK